MYRHDVLPSVRPFHFDYNFPAVDKPVLTNPRKPLAVARIFTYSRWNWDAEELLRW